MKRLMIGLAAVMMTSAAWSQAPAQETVQGPFQCTLAVTNFKDGKTQVLTARLKTVEACKSWGLDATHLDGTSNQYELAIHDPDGHQVSHQRCTVQGALVFDSSHSKFNCKDVAA
ncbi:MAG TPA: hypothetical protein VGL66_12095 [Caulobacteraceae bacterium]|jgi:hypothetical protein